MAHVLCGAPGRHGIIVMGRRSAVRGAAFVGTRRSAFGLLTRAEARAATASRRAASILAGRSICKPASLESALDCTQVREVCKEVQQSSG